LPHLELRRAFLKAMDSDGLVCLCGALAAGADSLPAPVVLEAKHFLEAGIAFLIGNSDGKPSARRAWAMKVLALLEGAMVLSLALGDPKCFARATQDRRNLK
jgi:TetR/AcrR family transcriptional repressor of nem operon